MFALLQAAGWPAWPLLACSVAALALALDRMLALRGSKIAPAGLVSEALNVATVRGSTPEVLAALSRSCALGSILAEGLRAGHGNPRARVSEVRRALEQEGRAASARLERGLPALATIASVAPLLGLLGTVVGMIEIFGASASAIGGDPVALARGISVALYNTAFGLIVAIPALVFWRYFRSRVDDALLRMEIESERFATLLAGARQP